MFDQDPSKASQSQKEQKNRFKEGVRAGMAEKKKKSVNQSNNSAVNHLCNNLMRDDNHSEVTLYRNAVQQKHGSSSSEDGLDISDESNLLNDVILGNPDMVKAAQLSTSGRKPTVHEDSPEEQAMNSIRLAE